MDGKYKQVYSYECWGVDVVAGGGEHLSVCMPRWSCAHFCMILHLLYFFLSLIVFIVLIDDVDTFLQCDAWPGVWPWKYLQRTHGVLYRYLSEFGGLGYG
jgi:hypothetical protein